MNNERYIFVTILGIVFLVTAIKPQSISLANQTSDKDLSLKMADTVISRFHKTLEIGAIFDEMASKKATENLQKGRYNLGKVNVDFLKDQGTEVKKRLFYDEMNYHFLKLAVFMTFSCKKGPARNEDLCISNEFMKDYSEAIGKFQYVKEFFDDGDSNQRTQIKTSDELAKYLSELELVTGILKKHLPDKYFESKVYEGNYKDFINSQDEFLRPKVECLHGASYFDVPKNESVILVIRDIFVMYFIKENDQIKLLGFGTDN